MVARIVRFSIVGLVLVAAAAYGTYSLSKVTPTGFLPEDDQGAFFVVVQLPDGARSGGRRMSCAAAEAILKEERRSPITRP